MNKKYNLKLDLQFRCNNSTMKFDEFDNNTSDFFIRVTRAGELIDISKAIVTLVVIKPDNSVDAQFVDIDSNRAYCDLKPTMKNLVGKYEAIASITVDGETVNTGIDNPIIYEVTENKFLRQLNQKVVTEERFTLLTDMINRLSTIEISEEQRVINEAERILSEENRKIEEAKRVEAELIRQHEEADRAKYDATRESNENIRKQNESIRLANETNRIDEEAKRVEEENKRKLAEEERNANYNFMTEDEERRRSEANAHKEAENLRVQAETNRVNEEAKRRTTEQARVSAENTRVSNENIRKTNEEARQNNETHRVEAETQRQNRYNSFIADAEANANNFENYTNAAKVKEEERKSNELDRKSQEDRRVSNEVERISNENTRKANEAVREKNETSRQYVFENKVNEVDKKIVELNTTKDNFVSNINTKVDTKISEIDNVKDNFVSSVNTKVDSKISELDNAKSDMTTTVSNKVNEVEARFNALTSSQQQDAEVIDARVDFKGVAFNSLKERIDYTDKLLRDSTISTVTTESDFTTVEATSNGYFDDVKLEGKTLVNLVDRYDYLTNQYYNTSYLNRSLLKPNTIYTVIVQNTCNNDIEVYCNENLFIEVRFTIPANNFVIKRLSSLSEMELKDTAFLKNSRTQTEGFSYKAILLEGDHTQNPLSYFEGLKSVGQDVDEISVESVNENLFNKNNCTYNINGGGYYISNYININDKLYYDIYKNLNASKIVYYEFLDKNKKRIYINYNISYPQSGIIENTYDAKYIRLHMRHNTTITKEEIDNNYGVIISSSPIKSINTPHQADKKRLLYYNEETQTWEKPILREWDSIEKHANGKYYYHQRSGEVVLNGSESWSMNNTADTNNLYYCECGIYVSLIKSGSRLICNTLQVRQDTVTDKVAITTTNQGIMLTGTKFIRIKNSSCTSLNSFKQWLQANNVTVVYQLAEEKVYECTNIDLITYNGETNFIVESGAITPKTTLKVHNNISNVVSLLQKKVSLLESNVTSYMITQNRLMLASRYNADTVSFKVDVASFSDTFEYDNDLYELILNNILVGKDNYNREYIENLTRFYWMDFVISDEMYSTLFEIIEEQHNPKIEEETPLI